MSMRSEAGGHSGEALPGGDDAQAFRDRFYGRFAGLLAWEDVAAVFARVIAVPSGWWIYDTREPLPTLPEDAGRLAQRVGEIEGFLRRHQRADYCGFVYVDDKEAPTLIKVFDPRNASSCSLGSPVPVYTLSRLKPSTLPFDASEGGAPGGADMQSSGRLKRFLKGWT